MQCLGYTYRTNAAVIAGVCLVLALNSSALAQTTSAREAQKGNVVTTKARGPFDVKVTPAAEGDNAAGGFGRLTLDKQFHGDLDASSAGEMLAAATAVEGSAAYVALERISGTLHGKRGTFFLQHNGTMSRGAAEMVVTVVPDSGTDQLVGLSGKMAVIIAADGTHSYEFDYIISAP